MTKATTTSDYVESLTARPRVDGKFLAIGQRRFLIKGVSYGTFVPDANGEQYPSPPQIARDITMMSNSGFNTIRTYTEPSSALLDAATDQNLRIIAGLPWSQHIPFLDDPKALKKIRRNLVESVRRLAAKPSLLMFAIGNEIPAGIVRWHGAKRIEHFLHDLYQELKATAPDHLFTYVNFPPTEHLDLECFDVCSFNVYLHRETELRAYLARLHHIAGAKPLLLAEAGADSIRETPEGQARLTTMQLKAAFTEGACGAVAYTWTDEWWRGGHEVNDWAFGLVDKNRDPKPALAAVAQTLNQAPFPKIEQNKWPSVSVVVCAYNAADTLSDCLNSLQALIYPNFEIIVVNDGSSDTTAAIAREQPNIRLIEVQNGGLSAARNAGLFAATGDLVAYTDADCRVDVDWLTYLVQPMLTSSAVGVGGPNVVPQDDPWIAQCVARAPGGPTHVMLDDRIAEHIPGCNMAFRRQALLSVGGFNAVYLRAGDDVDICWRLQGRGLTIVFSPSALVWHHHRSSIKAYWRQQTGYGEGETWLDAHHPEKFLGDQMLWHGRIYSSLPLLRRTTGRRVNNGVWGTAAFPSVYATRPHAWHFLPHSPAWMGASLVMLLIGIFGPLAGMDAAWLPLITGSAGILTTLFRCGLCAWQSDLRGLPSISLWPFRKRRIFHRAVIGWLHLIQPWARLVGRLRGLAQPPTVQAQHVTRHPWKSPVPTLQDALRVSRLFKRHGSEYSFWSESRLSHTELLTELVGVLRASRPAQPVYVDEGWRPDRDLSLAIGKWAWLHIRSLVEDHAGGHCLFRVRARLRFSFVGTVRSSLLALVLAGGTSASIFLYQPSVGVGVSIATIGVIVTRAVWQTIRGTALLNNAVIRVATAAGMMPLPLPRTAPISVRRSAKTTLSEQ